MSSAIQQLFMPKIQHMRVWSWDVWSWICLYQFGKSKSYQTIHV